MPRLFAPRCLIVLEPRLVGVEGERLSIPIIPSTCDWTSEEAQRADTARVTFNGYHLPLDPRVFTDIRVTVYMAAAEDPRIDMIATNRRYARFIGFADDFAPTFDSSGWSCRFAARDYRGRLMDTRLGVSSVLTDRPLSQVIRDVLRDVPGFEVLPVEVEDDTAPSSYTKRKRWAPESDSTVWDAIVAIVRSTGQIADWRLDTLRVRRAAEIDRTRSRILTIGDDISSFEPRKGLGPLDRRAIEIRQLNPRTRETVVGRYPADPRIETLVFPASGELTKAALDGQARNIFDRYNRRQIEGSVSTRAGWDRNGDDLMDLRSGDALYVRGRAETPEQLLGFGESELAALLMGGRQGAGPSYTEGASWLDEATARRVAREWVRAQDLAPLFSVRRARHSWGRDGYTLDIDFENVVGA